jgi:hypothetical protein
MVIIFAVTSVQYRRIRVDRVKSQLKPTFIESPQLVIGGVHAAAHMSGPYPR